MATTERVRQAVALKAIPHPDTPAGVLTISAGIAQLSLESDLGPATWIRRAENAMYTVKSEGRNCVRAASAIVKATAR